MTEEYEDRKTAGTMQEEFERWQKQKEEAERTVKDGLFDEDGMMPDDDKIHPTHYQSFYKDGIDCLTAMEHAFGKTCVAHFALGNAMKYLWRHCSKGKMQDIDKAIEYLKIYKKLDVIDLGD